MTASANKKRWIETNVIVRHLVQDHEKHSRAASKLFDASDRGLVILVILPAVLAECVFVLESFYKHARPAIAATLSRLIASPGVECDDLAIHLDALARFSNTTVHYVDCTIAAYASATQWPIASFDVDFKKFGDVSVELD